MKHIRTTIQCLMDRARAFHDAQFNHNMLAEKEIPELAPLNEALKELKWAKHKFNSTYDLRLHNRADYSGIDPLLADFGQRLYLNLRKRHFPTYVHTAHRSHYEQMRLFRGGLSKLKNGPHQRGAAFDLVHADVHWNLPKSGWNYIGLVGKQLIRQNYMHKGNPLIEWGGDWSFYDPAHWQLAEWRQKPITETTTPVRSHPATMSRIKNV